MELTSEQLDSICLSFRRDYGRMSWLEQVNLQRDAREWLKAFEASDIPNMPTVVCLCGSTRFGDAFREVNCRETLAGKIVLSIGCNMKTDQELFGHLSPEELDDIKAKLDILHLRKIDMADEVLILNVDGYIGESTHREMMYAIEKGKVMRFLERQDKPPEIN